MKESSLNEKRLAEGFYDGVSWLSSLNNLKGTLEKLNQTHNGRENFESGVIEFILYDARTVLKNFNKQNRKISEKYNLGLLEESIASDYFDKTRKDLIKTFGVMYKSLKHYLESMKKGRAA